MRLAVLRVAVQAEHLELGCGCGGCPRADEVQWQQAAAHRAFGVAAFVDVAVGRPPLARRSPREWLGADKKGRSPADRSSAGETCLSRK